MQSLKNELSIKPKVKLIKKTLIIDKTLLVAANKTRRKDVCLISLFLIGKDEHYWLFHFMKGKTGVGTWMTWDEGACKSGNIWSLKHPDS